MPQPGSRTIPLLGTPEPANRLVHYLDDDRGRVKGVEGSAFGQQCHIPRQERTTSSISSPSALCQVVHPCSGPSTGSGKIESATGPKSRQEASRGSSPLLGGGQPPLMLDFLENTDGPQGRRVSFGLFATGNRKGLPSACTSRASSGTLFSSSAGSGLASISGVSSGFWPPARISGSRSVEEVEQEKVAGWGDRHAACKPHDVLHG